MSEPVEPPDELSTLRRWLADLRATVERKAEGLTPEQLAARSVPPSDLSVLGLVRHLAQMEHYWFVRTLSRADEPQLYVPDGDWDAQFRDAVADEAVVADAFDTWRAVCARADAVMDGLEPADLEFVWDPDDRIGSVRDALIQVLYEYSRHCGHLDLLREAIDGQTGEWSLGVHDLEAEPAREVLDLGGHRVPGLGGARLVLVHRVDPEHALGRLGGGVELPDQPVAVQDRQRVVAPDPLLDGLVHLQQVVELEELVEPLAVLDQAVERREQRGPAGRTARRAASAPPATPP